MLADAPSIEEQADILHYLVLCYGTRHKFHVTQVTPVYPVNQRAVTLSNLLYLQLAKDIEIRDLLRTLYEKAVVKKSWAIVRQAAGFLGIITNSRVFPTSILFNLYYTNPRTLRGRFVQGRHGSGCPTKTGHSWTSASSRGYHLALGCPPDLRFAIGDP